MESCDIQILNWKNFSKNILKNKFNDSLKYLEEALDNRTFLVEDRLTDADKSVFLTLHNNESFRSLMNSNALSTNLVRYYNYLVQLDEIKVVLSKLKTTTSAPKEVKSTSSVQFEDGGKFIALKNATKGNVVVRFPPEASGYLHIGHAKAALINQHYKDHYEGKLIMRFDDTNPAKESAEFEKIILEDVKSLGITYDHFSYSSDHFDLLIKYCEDLISSGNAYADDTDPVQMKKDREEKVISKCRNRSVEENLHIWNEMKLGSDVGVKNCVRIKFDMNSNNGCMRDPTIYRCKPEIHPKTGDKYKVYPTYDFACPIVDSIEGVTHTLRTSEYNDRNDQFYKFLDLLNLRKSAIADYSRLSLQNTVLSKRKLTYIVDEGYVDGWDDPRMPTVRGILRHGMTIDGLKEFVLAQGFGRANVVMEWDKLWSFNKKVIDPIVPRYTGLTGSEKSLVLVKIIDQSAIVKDSVVKHPKNDSIGKKSIWFSPSVYVEMNDAVDFVEGTNVTFINWGNILITKIHRNSDNTIKFIEGKLNLSDRDFKKTQKITWMPLGDNDDVTAFSIPISTIFYDNIITKNVLGKDDDFKNFLNKNSKREECLIGDIELKDLKKGEIVQLQRRGFFICDEEYRKKCEVTGNELPLVLINIPEGNTKERPTVGMKQKSGTTSKPDSGDQIAKNDKKKEKKDGSSARETKNYGSSARETKKDASSVKETKKDASSVKETKKDASSVKETKKDASSVKETKKDASSVKETKKDASSVKETKKDASSVKETKKDATSVKETKKDASSVKETKKDVSSVKETKKDATDVSKTESQVKKVTRLGLEVSKSENFSEWYTQIIIKAGLIEYYDIKGCYILLPLTMKLWEKIQNHINEFIEKIGVEPCSFPYFISKSALTKEKDHIADFSPEVAWVTMAGDKNLEEPIAIRPTSETAMYPYYAKYIQSHRDLPLKFNQWCSVVRWEFKHPMPFLRSREFHWQEGHTAFSNQKDAIDEVYQILDLYASVYEDLLAIPVVKGRKTEKEKFAGADFTTTTEVYIGASGRAIQGATSHHLGQNFSKMFDISFESNSGKQEFVYQNSWGMTTRTLGILVMVHGDDKGLVLPPRAALHQVVIVPCGLTVKSTDEESQSIYDKCKSLAERLRKVNIRVQADLETHRSPGFKFNKWELKGVPIRIEMGPKDIANKKIVLCYRLNGVKETIGDEGMEQVILEKLEDIQKMMFNKAKEELDSHRTVAYNMDNLCKALNNKMLVTGPFCGDKACEDKIKLLSAGESIVEEGAPSMGAKSLCIPFDQPDNLGDKCINNECTLKPKYFTMFGRSY